MVLVMWALSGYLPAAHAQAPPPPVSLPPAGAAAAPAPAGLTNAATTPAVRAPIAAAATNTVDPNSLGVPPTPVIKPSPANGLSIIAPTQLANWQKRLTLGPGDVININLYEQPDSVRSGITIGPDGRISYLEARDVLANDLTVDELREHLEQILLKYYRPPLRVIIQPQSFHSKKYYLLGNVMHTGVYPLDRPITIIEAIAVAGGFITTLQRRNSFMMADLEHSFLMRRGESNQFERVAVDFEGLFLRGDFTQNIGLAPGDYLYFPPADIKELYILGRGVGMAGPIPFSPDMTVIRAITLRGGFADKAYRQRVLVVRGSLSAPQCFIVNTGDILAARASDFRLEPRDIVYVSRRPWAKVEELTELAVSEFLYGAVTAWTFKNVGPLITHPLIK